jgi:hypothetical protein
VRGRHLVAGLVPLVLVLAACGGGGGGGGDEHPLGTKVVVQHTIPGGKGPGTTLGVTVKAVRKGTQEELKAGGFTIDKEDQDKTPYYVDVGYANQGSNPIKRQMDVGLEDGDGNLITSTVIFDFGGGKPFAKCPAVKGGVLAPGQTYATCTLFLVPPGTEPKRVSFLPNVPGKATDFVYWKAA